MEQLRPKDLFYQILDGLRSLTHYDHSSALLIRDGSDDGLQLVAEQISWTKAKSQRIGFRLAVGDDLKPMLESGQIHGFDRRGDEWRESNGVAAEPHADRRAETRDGRARAERLPRRQQRARGHAPARATDEGRARTGPDGRRRLSGGSRAAAEIAASVPAHLRRHAVVC